MVGAGELAPLDEELLIPPLGRVLQVRKFISLLVWSNKKGLETHSATFEFSPLAHILQMLLASKINSHISFVQVISLGCGSSKL